MCVYTDLCMFVGDLVPGLEWGRGGKSIQVCVYVSDRAVYCAVCVGLEWGEEGTVYTFVCM